ncbi:MAG TPA: sensor histidine kinase [Terriglobales bacterium]
MSTPAMGSESFFGTAIDAKRQRYAVIAVSILALSPFLVLPFWTEHLLATNFLPHVYCYLKNPSVVWTHVVADGLIGTAYLAISVTLGYLVYRARRDIPFHWMFLAFGLFIIACGGTHFMEVVTIWIPVYIFSAAVKLFTASVSVMTAAVLPFTVPRILTLVQQAKVSQQVTAELRASEERKAALLREVHHRVKNNLAVICSLLYLQSSQTKDEETIQVFREMENRVHSMALVHESLYGSENLARIDFAQYAQVLTRDILASYERPNAPVHLRSDMEPVTMNIDLAVPCGLILNELISNAFKHGFPNGAGGEIKLRLRGGENGSCTLCVEDNGAGIPAGLDVNTTTSLGLKLVRILTRQIHGAFELTRIETGTSACLQFHVNHPSR